jgi:hypothetical protein
MARTFLIFGLITGLLLTAACSSGNNKKNAASVTPIRTPTPAVSATPLAATPARSPSPAATPFPATTGGAGGATTPFPAVGTTTRTPAATSTSTSSSTTTATPIAATPPSAPPPPPPIPTGTARGGRDSSGATLPVGDLCPLGYPVKGADDQKAYKPGDPEYATIRPVACFQTPDDAVTAGYTLAHP